MNFSKIILRFRDIVTENDGTIAKHKKIITQEGYVWWAWWKKGNEKSPVAEFSEFSIYARDKNLDIYLMDSGQSKLYKATCCDINLSADTEILSPEPKKTPEYYQERKYSAWFKFSSINECSIEELRNYTYVQVDGLFIGNKSNYKKFYGKRIYDINELIQQNRTVWFLRDYKETDPDHEIILLSANIFEPTDFSTHYFETENDSILWLSDLHFCENNVFPISKQDKADTVTLTEHIKSVYPNFPNIGGLIITGDITSIGKKEGFDIAKAFITDLNRNLIKPLSSENIVFCPGNHDLIRKEELLAGKTPEKISKNPASSAAYRSFYHSIHRLNPNEYLACGKKLLMLPGRTVEIVALNSLILQQYKDFEGHGFLSQEQLDFAANKMGWENSSKATPIRIVIMHHHYLPACLVERVDTHKASSIVYDAERLMQWLQKYNIHILLHGHKHQTFAAVVGRTSNSDQINLGQIKNTYVVGMGGTGATQCENKFAKIQFDINKVTISFYRIFCDNIELDKLVQTITIPL